MIMCIINFLILRSFASLEGQQNLGINTLVSKRVHNISHLMMCLQLRNVNGNPDPLEKEMAAHSSILAWKISWTE